jgi:hypothetical protein
MLRYVDNPIAKFAEHWMKILQASFYSHYDRPVWIVELSVGKGQQEVDGWVFVEPDYMEIRFESHPSMAPPGFLSGKHLSQGINESSLALLFENPCEEDVASMESNIRRFIDGCIFCVRTLTDVANETCRHEATSYRCGCATIPIKKREVTQCHTKKN